jgi:hypothetical protein
MLDVTGNSSAVESQALERKIKYNYSNDDYDDDDKITTKAKTENKKKKIISASEIFDSDFEIEKKYAFDDENDKSKKIS